MYIFIHENYKILTHKDYFLNYFLNFENKFWGCSLFLVNFSLRKLERRRRRQKLHLFEAEQAHCSLKEKLGLVYLQATKLDNV